MTGKIGDSTWETRPKRSGGKNKYNSEAAKQTPTKPNSNGSLETNAHASAHDAGRSLTSRKPVVH
eukprot:736779-Pyramimonas_sp.AAC.1